MIAQIPSKDNSIEHLDLTDFDHSTFIKQLSNKPGVYQMFNVKGELLYVGKAKNLKKRVASYFVNRNNHTPKTTHMVAQIFDIQVIVTETELEALLLESNLIKQHHPRYNILLRDDKSYPYILVNQQQDFPRLQFYRGSRKVKGKLFGPFPNVSAVKETLELLQRIFKLRSCRDPYFNNRSRPCLEYQIKRCKAPCVGYISKEDYQKDLANAMEFLKGRSDELIRKLETLMMDASEAMAFEQAAMYRDQIQHLRTVQASQTISNQGGDADVIAVTFEPPRAACAVLLVVRQGQVVGSHAFFPKIPNVDLQDLKLENIMDAFISQYYLSQQNVFPKAFICNVPFAIEIQQAIEQMSSNHCQFQFQPIGLKKKWLNLALQNAQISLANQLSSQASLAKRYQALAEALELSTIPERMECFDISHTGGEYTVASCVVFDQNGPNKKAYRKFNIEGITGGDDYAAMKQAILRRYKRLLKEQQSLPDLLIIDGGKGQVRMAKDALTELNIAALKIIGVAKGVSRKPGLETIIIAYAGKEVALDSDNSALHLIQHIRDEAHRFAITNHRHKRETNKHSSVLEDIEGVGAKRRQALLKRFGGLKNLRQASLEEIKKVPGINSALAEKIYAYIHRS